MPVLVLAASVATSFSGAPKSALHEMVQMPFDRVHRGCSSESYLSRLSTAGNANITHQASRKQFYLVPGTGHGMLATQLDMMLKVLTEQVRPLAVEP